MHTQILLYNGSYVEFSNNVVSQLGAGIYVEYASSDFLLSVLNTGCFIRYYTTLVDIQPSQWVTSCNYSVVKLYGIYNCLDLWCRNLGWYL
jgi:hypothetical protein